MKKAYYIGANANGEQADGIIVEEIDPSIDLYFSSSGCITDFGYIIELLLPLKSIKYESGSDVEWGLFMKRHIPERNEEICGFPVERGGGNFYKNYGKVRFEKLPSSLSLKVIPSLTASYEKKKDHLTGIEEEDDKIEPELNIFFEPTSNLTGTATINPDFNIIEADALNIEVNNRYPIYYPEKRPFFLEATNPFNTDINIFHTRNIIDPEWGVKLSGSFGDYSLYGLTAVDEKVPGERFFPGYSGNADTPFAFLALTRKFKGRDDHIRLAGTIRKYKELVNILLNVDTKFRITSEIDMDGQLLVTNNELPEEEEDEKGIACDLELEYYNGT
jgi:hypothetical protein